MDYAAIFGGIASIIIGWYISNPTRYKNWVKITNSARGLKSNITDTTLYAGKLMSYAWIGVGLFLLLIQLL